MSKTIYSDDHKKLIKLLRKAREEAGMTQIQAAKKFGYTQAYISKVESGSLRVDVSQLKKFAAMYGKNVSYFLK